MTTRTRLVLYTILLLSVTGFLAWHWPHHSLWYDEALTTWVATGTWERLFHWCTQVDIQVPLHYIVLRGWVALVGNSEFSLHLLSALCVLLAVAAMIALTRRLLGFKASLISPILLAFTPGFLWIAYEVRAYALALALYAWATGFLLAILQSRKSYRWLIIAYCGLMLAMLYTHYTGIAALASHALIFVWALLSRREQTGQILRRALLSGIVIVLGFLPWLPVMLSRGATDRSYYPGSLAPTEAVGIMAAFKWLARDDFRWKLLDQVTPSPLSPFVTIGLLLLIAFPIFWLVKTRQWKPVIYGLALALPPIIMIVVIVYFRPKLAGRYAWPAWIGVDLLLTAGIIALSMWGHRQLNRQSLRLMLFGAIALVAIPWLTGQTGHPPKSDFRGAFNYVRENWREGDLVILRDGTLFPAAEYYQSPKPYIGLPDSLITDVTRTLQTDEAVAALTSLDSTTRGVWLVSWQGDVMEPQHIISGLLETISTHQSIDQTFEDMQLDYFALEKPPSEIERPVLPVSPQVTTPDNLALYAVNLLNDEPLRPGDTVVLHSWWQREGAPQDSISRISMRLKGADGTTYGQKDQPPSGWIYFPAHWPLNSPMLGRYDMTIPEIAPPELIIELIVYSIKENTMTPATLTVGTVKVIND